MDESVPVVDKLVIDAQGLFVLTGIVLATLLIGWICLFWVMKSNKESVGGLLEGPSFLQNFTVISVVSAASLLAFAGIIKGELIVSLLSGIVGYVLGTIKATSGREAPHRSGESHGPIEAN